MNTSIQFLPWYMYELSISLFILPKSEIHKLSFRPDTPNSSHFDSLHVLIRYSDMSTSLPPQSTMSTANIMDSGYVVLTPQLVHAWVWRTCMGSMHVQVYMVQPHIHVEAGTFSYDIAHLCLAISISCISLSHFSGMLCEMMQFDTQ